MNSKADTITLLGNNSGRNLGDAAIMSAIFDTMTRLHPDVRFLVPSVVPNFINKNYASIFNVSAINVLPWTGSLRLLGMPTISALAQSKVAFICDGIIFGRNLWSPHNFLSTLAGLLPFFRLTDCKLVCYLTGIGPFPSELSKKLARWVMNRCDYIVMRDNESKALAEKIGVTTPISVAGDATYLNYVSSEERAREVMKEVGLTPDLPMIGLNATSYFDSWLSKSGRLSSKEEFLKTYADSVNKAFADSVVQRVVFSCSPMDEEICHQFASMVGGKVVDNTRYLSHDIQAVMRECSLLVGMRFHSICLSSAVGVPVVGLVYMPKVSSLFSLYGTPELAVSLQRVAEGDLTEILTSSWQAREKIKEVQQRAVAQLRQSVEQSSRDIVERYFGTPQVTAVAA